MSGGCRRVLFLITRSVPGGAQSHLLNLMPALGAGWEPVLGAGEEGNLTAVARRLGVEVHVVSGLGNTMSPWRDVAAFRHLVALIRKIRPDLVATHSTKAGLLGRAAARRCRVPSVFTAHGWSFATGGSLARRAFAVPAERRAARWCRSIITVADADREFALAHRIAPAEKLVTIRHGVPDTPLGARPDVGAPVTIVTIARFEAPKDFTTLLHALREVTTPWRAVLVGGGPTRAGVEALARRLGVADRVEFTGARTDVAEVLASAQVFVLSSRWEGLPISILEAMRAGLPVVATEVGGIGEAVIAGETGFLVPAGAVGPLARRLEELCASPGLRARMGAAGREEWKARFRVERMAVETRALYESVLASPQATRPAAESR